MPCFHYISIRYIVIIIIANDTGLDEAFKSLTAAMIIGCSGIVSAIVGGFVSALLTDTASNVLFAILLVVVAIRIFFQQLRVPAS